MTKNNKYTPLDGQKQFLSCICHPYFSVLECFTPKVGPSTERKNKKLEIVECGKIEKENIPLVNGQGFICPKGRVVWVSWI
jgi:hypothetical protein